MQDRHTPDPAFLDRLETRVAAEVRRQRQSPAPEGWWVASRLKLAMAAAAIAIVSMGIGAAGVAATYQAQTNEQRDLLLGDLQRRLGLARQRVEIATTTLQRAQQQLAIGLVARDAVVDAQEKVAESQAEIVSLSSQVAEVRVTGRPPVDDLTAPAVQGHDYVIERLMVSLSTVRAALQAEMDRLREIDTRHSLGLADEVPLQMGRARVAEQESALAALQSKVDIRRRFIAGAVDARQAALQALQAEAVQRRTALTPKLQIAQLQLQRAQAMVAVGRANSVDVAQAKLDLEQVEADVAKAELDLALVRRELQAGTVANPR